MKRTLTVGLVAASLALTGCAGSMTLDDGGRYDAYRTSVVELAAAAQETERIRILALSRLAETADDRTRDRIVAELSGRATAPAQTGQALAQPQQPTHLGLEVLRTLGPGAIGLIGQGIAAWNQREQDILATQRHQANNDLINSTVTGAITSNTELGMRGMDIATQAVSKLPATITIHAPAAAPAAAPAVPAAPATE